ncbi:hypothetical protein JIG36_12220 [Actinoplanes sp. LDG1-06]|uniref:Uncharacterized protein n=1 Tax=Paractinoplanes ovalisporus TaxID=2810368 RepID=A0ABS2A917_9ACTN|nr:hypothetical protein [Actinoplanes ovalisporus]MBM2616322.1 hypothetical protein [Actinoplanes ovalisporus]
MSTTVATRPVPAPVPPAATVVPVLDGERAVGAWIVTHDGVVYRPVVDLTRLGGALLTLSAAVVVAAATAAVTARRPAVGPVTMGPGGWVSVRGAGRPRVRPGAPRPWWARLLGAHPLVVEGTPRRSRK